MTEPKCRQRCHRFWGWDEWCLPDDHPRTVRGSFPGTFWNLHSWKTLCFEMLSGPERKGGSVSNVTSVSSGIASSFERCILFCFWPTIGLWWLFPGDFQPEWKGSQPPACAHMESRDTCISLMTFSVQPEADKGHPEIELVWPWASLFTFRSISIATEVLNNLCP